MYTLFTTLPFMVCLVWTVIGLLEWTKDDPARRSLTVFGAVASTLYFCHFLHFNELQSGFTESLYTLCTLSVYPLYLFYIYRLTDKTHQKWFFLWLMPALAMFAWSLSGRQPAAMETCRAILIPTIALLVGAVAGRQLAQFRCRVRNYYANPEGKLLDPVLILLALLLLTALSSTVAGTMGRTVFEDSALLTIPSLLFSILLFCIFYVGFRVDMPVEEVRDAPAGEDAHPGITEEQQKQLMAKIHEQMTAHELFRTKGLTISDLAEAVGSNRTYVSYTINQQSHCTFSDYVNQIRIWYVVKLMKEGSPLSLSEMGELAGFNERTSFYRSFKRIMGCAPSEYWARLKG